jgi:hypothetical protein
MAQENNVARRYIGDAVIEITYRDGCEANGGRDDYIGRVTANGRTWHFDALYAPQCGHGAGIAYDSSEAYDSMAASAVSFGGYYTTHNRGNGLPNWAPDAETADAIDQATVWATDEAGLYAVRRSPKPNARVFYAA